MIDNADESFLTIREAAERLRIKKRTLDNLRWQGTGPPFRRHGGRIVYLLSELLAWSDERRAQTLSKKEKLALPFPNDGSAYHSCPRNRIPHAPSPAPHLEREPQRAGRSLYTSVSADD